MSKAPRELIPATEERAIESTLYRQVRVIADGAKGFQARNLWWMRDFYLKFPILNALRGELSWTLPLVA